MAFCSRRGAKITKTTLAVMGLVLVLPFMLMGCGEIGSHDTVEYSLHGDWESTDTSTYSGALVFDSDTVTITGYTENQWNRNDNKLPFKDFAKGAPLSCYTEDGNLYIRTVNDIRSIPYRYFSSKQGKYLFFTFGGREEALKRINN